MVQNTVRYTICKIMLFCVSQSHNKNLFVIQLAIEKELKE